MEEPAAAEAPEAPEEPPPAPEPSEAEVAAFREQETTRRASRAARFGLPVKADAAPGRVAARKQEAPAEEPAPPAPEETDEERAAREAAEAEAREVAELKAQLLEEQKKSRLERFGEEKMETEEPAPEPEWAPPEGVPWSLYKKQILEAKRGPATKGLALPTGFDISTDEERAKAATRLAKFDPEAAAKKAEEEEESKREFEARAKRLARFGGADLGDAGGAWTRFETKELKPMALTAADLFASDEARSAAEPEASADPSEKLHLCVLPCDRKVFKRLRSSDLEGHFAAYGASYVEWLGDTSVNIWFPDQHAAARARLALTSEIPEAPDALDAADGGLGARGWRLARVAKKAGDKWGRAGTAARLLCRFGASTDVLAAKPKFANPDPLKRGRHKPKAPPKRKRGRERKAMAPDRVVAAMEGGLGAARGYGRAFDDEEDPRAAKAAKFGGGGGDAMAEDA